ncbi:MAG: hypothetical protein ABR610_03420 [Thermoanaerobaculia bacterium]
MPYLLDGNNLIASERRARTPGEDDRSAFEIELAERLRGTRSSVRVFYDGPPEQTRTLGSLTIRRPGGSADEAILREISAAADARGMTVVTADRDLARRCRDAGAKTLDPGRFWDRFGKGDTAGRTGPEKSEVRVDVEEWMKYFSDPENKEP